MHRRSRQRNRIVCVSEVGELLLVTWSSRFERFESKGRDRGVEVYDSGCVDVAGETRKGGKREPGEIVSFCFPIRPFEGGFDKPKVAGDIRV